VNLLLLFGRRSFQSLNGTCYIFNGTFQRLDACVGIRVRLPVDPAAPLFDKLLLKLDESLAIPSACRQEQEMADKVRNEQQGDGV